MSRKFEIRVKLPGCKEQVIERHGNFFHAELEKKKLLVGGRRIWGLRYDCHVHYPLVKVGAQ